MPTLDWLKKEFNYGYDSGNVLSVIPNRQRRIEEKRIGGSYRKVFMEAVLPYLKPDSVVLELGPGKGSWSRAILENIPDGQLHVVDYQDVSRWLEPEKYDKRLICHKVDDNLFSSVEDDCFDFFWSFGVLCHNNVEQIGEILKNSLCKMKPGGVAVHQYADWKKLEIWGWKKGRVPLEFKDKKDEDIWWPRNDEATMVDIAKEAGWEVLNGDLGLLRRDSIILLKRA